MKGRWSFWFALAISVCLNGGLIAILFRSVEVSQFYFSQNAGSNIDQYSHSLNIQFVGSEQPPNQNGNFDKDPTQIEEKIIIAERTASNSDIPEIPPSPSPSPSSSGTHLISSIQSEQKTQVVTPRHDLPRKAFAGNRVSEQQSSTSAEQQRQIPLSHPHLEDAKKAVTKSSLPDNNSVRRENKARSALSVTAQTRLGDQFATDLSVKVMQNIEGCYPEASKRRGEEGVVLLKLLANNGRLEVQVIESSGYVRLDRCAIAAVQKAFMKSDIHELPSSGLSLKPIRFKLR